MDASLLISVCNQTCIYLKRLVLQRCTEPCCESKSPLIFPISVTTTEAHVENDANLVDGNLGTAWQTLQNAGFDWTFDLWCLHINSSLSARGHRGWFVSPPLLDPAITLLIFHCGAFVFTSNSNRPPLVFRATLPWVISVPWCRFGYHATCIIGFIPPGGEAEK